jgi:hypothetical protein
VIRNYFRYENTDSWHLLDIFIYYMYERTEWGPLQIWFNALFSILRTPLIYQVIVPKLFINNVIFISSGIRRCIQKFPDWPPGARTEMVHLSAPRFCCIAILWVSLVSFATLTLYVASQRVFIFVSIYFLIDSVRKLLDTPLYLWSMFGRLLIIIASYPSSSQGLVSLLPVPKRRSNWLPSGASLYVELCENRQAK